MQSELKEMYSPEVLVTHTKDVGHILQGLHVATSKIGGEIDIPTAIAVAQLALKHRENKNLRQRVIVFVGSPLDGQAADEKAMVRLAKKLKKNNVAIDVICFGDGIEEAGEDGKTVLRTFVESANSSDNSYVTSLLSPWHILNRLCFRDSHLVAIPPSSRLLSEQIAISPILAADRGAGIPDEFMPRDGPAPSSSNTNEFEFGVDPNVDPELALVSRIVISFKLKSSFDKMV
jgi:26S proteasome regulatory subunit N10